MNGNIACCGADCALCDFLGSICAGCNALCGRVFHAPKGKACPIYDCCKNQNGYRSCGECARLPCDIIMNTRDPSLSEEAFLQSVAERVRRLKGENCHGV
ncbi:MAG: hypothetical protein IJ234_00165 [Clostridia bacterium]|nr:hypothetical protein [Clostridia bacterium]